MGSTVIGETLPGSLNRTNQEYEFYDYTGAQNPYNVAYEAALLNWAQAAQNSNCNANNALLVDDDDEEPFH